MKNLTFCLLLLGLSSIANAEDFSLDPGWNIHLYTGTIVTNENDGAVKLQEAYESVKKQIADDDAKANSEIPYEALDLQASCEDISAFKQCTVKALVKWGERTLVEDQFLESIRQ